MELSLEDEFLLTQLRLDGRNITIYDISPTIKIGSFQPMAAILQPFKCFHDLDYSIFFVELSDKTNFNGSILNKSSLMTILDIAENLTAKSVCVCIPNDTPEIEKEIENLSFVGFKRLTPDKKLRIS